MMAQMPLSGCVMASEFARDATSNGREPLSTPRANCTVTGGASSTRRSLAVAALVVVALLLPLLRGFDKPAKAMDEGSLLVYPELILKGNLPYAISRHFMGQPISTCSPASMRYLARAFLPNAPPGSSIVC